MTVAAGTVSLATTQQELSDAVDKFLADNSPNGNAFSTSPGGIRRSVERFLAELHYTPGGPDELCRRADLVATLCGDGSTYSESREHGLACLPSDATGVRAIDEPVRRLRNAEKIPTFLSELEQARRDVGVLLRQLTDEAAREPLKRWARGIEIAEDEARLAAAYGCYFLHRLTVDTGNEDILQAMAYSKANMPCIRKAAESLVAWSRLMAAPSGKEESTEPEEHLPQVTKKEQTSEWLAKAMLLVRDNPGWPDADIAKRVNKHPSTLSRNETYRLAAATARASNDTISTGHVTVDSDTGLHDVEGDVQPCHPGQGEPIPGSRLLRDYCRDCKEPIRVTQDSLGKGNVCEECERD